MARVLVAVVLAGVLTIPTLAHASPPGMTPPVETTIRRRKSETTATVLTLAGIAAPFALTYLMYEPDTDNPVYAPYGAITGLVLPAAGHWYTGRVGTYGMLIRLGGLTTAMVGLSYLDDADRCARGEQVTDGCFASDRTVGQVAVGLGIAVWASSWVYDVWSARREVRRHNARNTIAIVPLAGRDSVGVSIGGGF